MTYKKILTIICLFSVVLSVSGQRRQLQEARAIIKSGKNFDKVEKMMTDLLKDSANQNNKRIYDFWLQSVEAQYSQLNVKMYQKQQVDTVKLFDLTKRIFIVGERLDSIDMMPDKKGRVNIEYRKSNAQRLATYRPNLFYGGAYYIRKSEFAKAFDFFERYIDCAQQPLFTSFDLNNTDQRLGETAYWASYCGYKMNDPVLTLRYSEMARRDTARLESTLQIIAEAWNQLKDQSQYEATLWEGFRLHPTSSYFFPRLMDSYTRRGNYEQGLAIANEALASDSLNQLFLFAKSTMLLNLGQYAECLKYTCQLLSLNDQMADAYYNAGTACLNIALRMDSRRHKKQLKKMYQQALPYMETYRKMAPNEVDKWAPALYRIYFNLNMGKQFDEIEKVLKKQKR